LAVIDGATHALLTTMEAQSGAFGVDVHPALQRAYVSSRDADAISVFDTSANIRLWPQTTSVGGAPYALAVDAARNRLYVLYALSGAAPDRVAVFSLASSGTSRIGTVVVEDGGAQGGTGIAVNPTTGHVFVANSARNRVTVIDGPALAVLATVPVGRNPGMVGVNPAANRVYIANRGDDSVQVIVDAFTRRPANR
jgi:YVTN family beta-propeller protein